jgi:hypothetical protein
MNFDDAKEYEEENRDIVVADVFVVAAAATVCVAAKRSEKQGNVLRSIFLKFKICF